MLRSSGKRRCKEQEQQSIPTGKNNLFIRKEDERRKSW